jgi:hypothetical protein
MAPELVNTDSHMWALFSDKSPIHVIDFAIPEVKRPTAFDKPAMVSAAGETVFWGGRTKSKFFSDNSVLS